MPILGRGATSIVYDAGDGENVFVLTRDRIKTEWMQQQLDATYVDEFDMYHPLARIRDRITYVYRMKRLYPLDAKNKKVMRMLKQYIHSTQYRTGFDTHKFITVAQEELDRPDFPLKEKDWLETFITFISNYDDKMFGIDIHSKNWMQTADGELVLVDPVVDTEIVRALMEPKRSNRQW